MVRRRKGDDVNGVLLLDKPVGPSSNAALQKIRKALNAKKAGHTGTLDPLASGLLPLCFGEATKFSADLLNADKQYEALIQFGVSTTTGDAEGEILNSQVVCFTEEQIRRALKLFEGEIEQLPPMYSALKKDGVPLYELARKGQEIERKPRKVVISEIELLDCTTDTATIRAKVSKGTYIRTLGEDIGKALGCGAHLKSLRRIAIAGLSIEDSVKLEDFLLLPKEQAQQALLPVDTLMQGLVAFDLTDDEAQRFRHGQKLKKEPADAVQQVRVYGPVDGIRELLGVAVQEVDGTLVPARLISFIDN